MSLQLCLAALAVIFSASASAFASASTSVAADGCPSADWVLFESGCYWKSPFQLSWRRIADVCDSISPGALPTSVHSFTEDAFIAETLLEGARGWLGLHRNDTHISWTWADGSDYNRYYFGCNEPSFEGEACAVINHGRIGEWASFSCDDEQYFVCRVNAK
ncbi:Lectin BRA-3 [Amphibalanus amphitrite]|uniref:Lectin BRA-3 n=1 Tax=Amphibalanus amphitrite TaxID=1232801 RepID=A0A6A4XAS8_AMPAM|nr:Lectin BRA-3 [Amphibalanus amphitrite]